MMLLSQDENGITISLEAEASDTIEDVKAKIQNKEGLSRRYRNLLKPLSYIFIHTGIPMSEMVLNKRGKMLNDQKSLEEERVMQHTTLQFYRRLRGGGRPRRSRLAACGAIMAPVLRLARRLASAAQALFAPGSNRFCESFLSHLQEPGIAEQVSASTQTLSDRGSNSSSNTSAEVWRCTRHRHNGRALCLECALRRWNEEESIRWSEPRRAPTVPSDDAPSSAPMPVRRHARTPLWQPRAPPHSLPLQHLHLSKSRNPGPTTRVRFESAFTNFYSS